MSGTIEEVACLLLLVQGHASALSRAPSVARLGSVAAPSVLQATCAIFAVERPRHGWLEDEDA